MKRDLTLERVLRRNGERSRQARIVADRLMGKRVFLSVDEAADIKVLKARQLGMSTLFYNSSSMLMSYP